MNLKLIRKDFTEISTIGDLFIDENFYCYTLEDKVREIMDRPVLEWKIPGKTAIPCGVYDVTMSYSNRFKKVLPLLLNVSGFDGVRIHTGNTSADTEGCIIVGMTKSKDFLGKSRIAITFLTNEMLAAINRNEKIIIQITGNEV